MTNRCPALTQIRIGTFQDDGDLYLRCEGKDGHSGRHNHRRMRSWRNGDPGTAALTAPAPEQRTALALSGRMSAEILYRAADLMRERAESASRWEPAAWFAAQGAIYGGTAAPHQVITPVTTYDRDASHIASWHPAVALAVADWLDGTADEPWCCDECKFDPENDNRLIQQAVAVACAYLGETA